MEIRPLAGVSAPVVISFVTISLQRRESIHPWAESKARRHLAAPRKEITDTVGKEMLLFRCSTGREHESVMAMDLPFVIFIPYGRGSEEVARRVPPASLQLSSRRAETFYELVVTVQQGPQEQRKYGFAVPISRYDLLSTFGMFDQQKSAELAVDNIVTLRISLPRWSYGPLDPVSVFIGLVPNSLALDKAKRVTVQKLTLTVEEEIVYNHEGDEPMHKTRVRATTAQSVNKRLPEAGYFTNLLVVFPHNDLRTDGIIPRGKKEFPLYMAHSFTTTGTLYKIEYYIVIKVSDWQRPVCIFYHARSFDSDLTDRLSSPRRETLLSSSRSSPAPSTVKAARWSRRPSIKL